MIYLRKGIDLTMPVSGPEIRNMEPNSTLLRNMPLHVPPGMPHHVHLLSILYVHSPFKKFIFYFSHFIFMMSTG